MEFLLVIIFLIGYASIAFEHSIKINKTATALLLAVLCWTIYITQAAAPNIVKEELSLHLASISEILFFLLAAMTIVELIDAHQGFKIITDKITTRNKRKLLWIIAAFTFFLSAVIDNLTTAIVMIALLRKLMNEDEDRKLFAGVVIIAANAGGAWSPIGDITTTMLWIGGQLTAGNIIRKLFIPSIISLLIPLVYFTFKFKGEIKSKELTSEENKNVKGSNIILILGLGVFILVPAFKTITHLPPYIGMLFGLAILWMSSELIHSDKDEEERKRYSAGYALSRIDSTSILFFLGILLSVAALESTHILSSLAQGMNQEIKNESIIVTCLGLASAIIDNVPLVAASMGMYDISIHPTDSSLWEFLAYATGTGGSILIIGSAAGVAVMGMEKIKFMWYLKKISLIALLGYLSGALAYLYIHSIFF